MENTLEVHSTEQASGDPPDTVDSLTRLQQENSRLRAQLTRVIATASTNEKIWRHFIEIERILFRTLQPDQLAEELLRELKARFQPDGVVLFWCHPDVVERFFPGISTSSEPIGEGTWILPLPLGIGHALLDGPPKPFLLSPQNAEPLAPYLPETASMMRSGVIIPLVIHDLLFGALLLGSLDSDRYRPDAGTDLLEQLGIKIALCMENCLSYERAKDFAVEDPVTGLLNFFQIHTLLEREFRKARRLEAPLSVMLIEPRFFHQFSDNLDLANEVLKHVADLLKEILPPGETVLGRYGSDKFLVLLPGVQEHEAQEVLPFLNQTIRRSPFLYENTAILIQNIIGVGSLDEYTKRAQDLIDRAYSELCRLKMETREPSGE